MLSLVMRVIEFINVIPILPFAEKNSSKMIIDRVGIAVRTAFPTVIKRNMGTSYVLYAKAADPIQQLFLDKISEFKSKIK